MLFLNGLFAQILSQGEVQIDAQIIHLLQNNAYLCSRKRIPGDNLTTSDPFFLHIGRQPELRPAAGSGCGLDGEF